ncbi:MAG: T9SS type A sorting domain-containing protein [Flavobacteriales bacterium]|nr:T9SS type A sorting domain-containing protein [Flavobacteriales bacterium]
MNAQTTTTADLELIDATGRVVRGQRSYVVAQGTTSMEMDVQDLAPGAYTLRLIGGDALVSVPFQIVR